MPESSTEMAGGTQRLSNERVAPSQEPSRGPIGECEGQRWPHRRTTTRTPGAITASARS